MSGSHEPIDWVLLTRGDRRAELAAAIGSIGDGRAIVVLNDSDGQVVGAAAAIVRPGRNLGVPAGRDVGLRTATSEIVGFLDDDAAIVSGGDSIAHHFALDPTLGAVALRIVDEQGSTSRRHVPRVGQRSADASGEVATFLGGAAAIRRSAYDQVGGYFTDLFYGHEELELSWRLIDAGWRIRYLADVSVFHPRTEISRHVDGWRLTGRNRVWIARRTLPWPVAIFHVLAWLAVGTWRAPEGECRRSYVRGWLSGWRARIEHRPIRWRTVWRLAQLGRPPLV
ncbi:MAG: glycosyltransferase family 2 protein [Actinomycetota bacterium]